MNEIFKMKPEHIKINAIAPYLDSRFTQTLPRNKPMRLIAGNQKNHQLLWENTKTGEQILVPNIWYNQPVEWRISALEYTCKRLLDQARVIRHDREPGWEKEIDNIIDQEKRLIEKIKIMKETGKVIC